MNDAKKMREAIARLKETQVGMAGRLGVTCRTMRRYVAGDSPVPPHMWLAIKQLESEAAMTCRCQCGKQ